MRWPRDALLDGVFLCASTGSFSAPLATDIEPGPEAMAGRHTADRRLRFNPSLAADFRQEDWRRSAQLDKEFASLRLSPPSCGGGGEQCWIFDLFLQLLPLDSNPAQRRWMRGTILAWSFLSCGSRCQIQEWPGGVRGGKHCWMWTLLLCASCLLPLTSGLAHATPLSVQTAEWHVYKKLTSGLTHAPRYLRR